MLFMELQVMNFYPETLSKPRLYQFEVRGLVVIFLYNWDWFEKDQVEEKALARAVDDASNFELEVKHIELDAQCALHT